MRTGNLSRLTSIELPDSQTPLSGQHRQGHISPRKHWKLGLRFRSRQAEHNYDLTNYQGPRPAKVQFNMPPRLQPCHWENAEDVRPKGLETQHGEEIILRLSAGLRQQQQNQ